jgi:Asp-tRNA(Asn)/Glu-tRNA(Gln) amidotransferase C subunit
MATHTFEQVDTAIEKITKVANQLGVLDTEAVEIGQNLAV